MEAYICIMYFYDKEVFINIREDMTLPLNKMSTEGSNKDIDI